MFINYYEILIVPENCTTDQIKKRYRELAMQFHPDKNTEKGAKEKFQGISDAYQVLSDVQKRRNFDSQLSEIRKPKNQSVFQDISRDIFEHIYPKKARSQGSSGSQGPASDFFKRDSYQDEPEKRRSIFPDFSSIFNHFDIHVEIKVTELEFRNGCSKKLRYRVIPAEMELFYPDRNAYEIIMVDISPRQERILYPGMGTYITDFIRSSLYVKITRISGKTDVDEEDGACNYKAYLTDLEFRNGTKITVFSPADKENITVDVKRGFLPGQVLRVSNRGFHKKSDPTNRGNIYIKLFKK